MAEASDLELVQAWREASFRAYLFAIARNELYHYLERAHRGGPRVEVGDLSLQDLATSPSAV